MGPRRRRAGAPGAHDAAHLQPPRARPTFDLQPVDQALLDELERGEGYSREEWDDAERARQSLEQRLEDRAFLSELSFYGYAGPKYEAFASALVAYALPVLRSWLRRGLIFEYCAEKGRAVQVTDFERAYFEVEGDDRMELAIETAARALKAFRTHALIEKKWSWEGGATLKTYYIGACLQAFPNVFRRWQRERQRWAPTGRYGVDPAVDQPDRKPLYGSELSDPGVTVVEQQLVHSELCRMPEPTRQAMALVLAGFTFSEIATQLGTTERAIEGRLYRYRTERSRRRDAGGAR